MEVPINLQKFPFEIRLEIYKHMQPPFRCHVSDCRSLVLSNSELSHEFIYEVIKDVNNYYEDIEKVWMNTYAGPLIVSKPVTIAEVKNVTVSIPHSFFRRDHNGSSPRFPEALLALIPLHLSSINIDFYEDEKAKDGEVPAPVGLRQVGGFVNCTTHLLYEKIVITVDNQTIHTCSGELGTSRLRISWGPLSVRDAYIVGMFLRDSYDAYETTIDHDDALEIDVGVTWNRTCNYSCDDG